jgi:hypothetical protein
MTAVFLDVTPHTLVENYRCFREPYCLHLQFTTLLWNIYKSLCDWVHSITCHETITFKVTTVRTLNMAYIILLTEQTWKILILIYNWRDTQFPLYIYIYIYICMYVCMYKGNCVSSWLFIRIILRCTVTRI